MSKIETLTLKSCLNSSLYLLKENEKLINDLNVFPVPDGDTGTNMRSTFESGLNNAKSDDINSFLNELSTGMLIGARGNSGVILSIIVKGFFQSIKNKKEFTPISFLEALKDASDFAYKKIKNPVEGTILTVLKLGIKIDNNFNTFKELLTLLIDKMTLVLNETPTMLKSLEEANVVDAGGAGLLLIFIGFLNYLTGKKYDNFISTTQTTKVRYYKKDEHKSIAYVAYCIGNGIKEIFYDLGCDVIIESPNTINPSVKEIIDAIKNIDADNIIILPNNKNAILTTKLAKDLINKENIYILETTSIAEGYFALSMMVRTSDDLDYQIKEMKKGIEDVISIDIAKATKNGSYFNVNYKKDEYIFIVNGVLKHAGYDLGESLNFVLNLIDIKEKEMMVVFTGYDFDNNKKEKLSNFISDNLELDFGVLDGEFKNLEMIIGIS